MVCCWISGLCASPRAALVHSFRCLSVSAGSNRSSCVNEINEAARLSLRKPRPGRGKEQPMQSEDCGCSQATSINELCPQCQADYEEYLRVMTMLRTSLAESE